MTKLNSFVINRKLLQLKNHLISLQKNPLCSMTTPENFVSKTKPIFSLSFFISAMTSVWTIT